MTHGADSYFEGLEDPGNKDTLLYWVVDVYAKLL
jgi:hypothetical protein